MKTITKCGEYVARNGDVGRAVCVDKAGDYPVVVVWPNGTVTTHRTDGRLADGRAFDCDLIREHREPQRFEFEGVVGVRRIAGEGRPGARNSVLLNHPDAPTLTGTRYRVTIEEIVEGGES